MKLLEQQLALHPDTGLLADFLVYNKSEKRYKPSIGKILERERDGDFGYNACRFAPDRQYIMQVCMTSLHGCNMCPYRPCYAALRLLCAIVLGSHVTAMSGHSTAGMQKPHAEVLYAFVEWPHLI